MLLRIQFYSWILILTQYTYFKRHFHVSNFIIKTDLISFQLLKGLRVDKETEQIGMDKVKHGGAAYEMTRRKSVWDSFSKGKENTKQRRRVDSVKSGDATIIENGQAVKETEPVPAE